MPEIIEDFQRVATRKFGPFPAWVWAVGAGAGVAGFVLLRRGARRAELVSVDDGPTRAAAPVPFRGGGGGGGGGGSAPAPGNDPAQVPDTTERDRLLGIIDQLRDRITTLTTSATARPQPVVAPSNVKPPVSTSPSVTTATGILADVEREIRDFLSNVSYVGPAGLSESEQRTIESAYANIPEASYGIGLVDVSGPLATVIEHTPSGSDERIVVSDEAAAFSAKIEALNQALQGGATPLDDASFAAYIAR